MRIINEKGLLLKLRNPDIVLDNINKSKLIEDEQVIVRWGLEESLKLRELNFINTPSPITRDYKWTGFHKPMKHQIDTAAFLSINKRAFCFNEQGTGKTASCIWAADYLMNEGLIDRVLVICPLSIMQSAWQEDLFKFAMHRTCSVAYGTPRKRRAILEEGSEFVIINYDGVEILSDEIKDQFDLIIVDEANAYKNYSTKRWKCLYKLLNDSTWVWMLTGTPAAHSPVDAFGLARMIVPDRVPRFMGSFKDKVMQRISQFKWIPRPEAVDIVHNVLQPSIRFTKKECLDLPEITYLTRRIPLTKQQDIYRNKIKKDNLILAADECISAVNAATLLNKLLQLSCGAVYSDTGEIISFDGGNRLQELLAAVRESSNKVLIFVPFKHAIEIISEALTKEKITNDIISGEITPKKRTGIFSAFQDKPDPKVLIIQPQAAAHGVTLTAADTIIWYGPPLSLETYLQANARAHRKGQKNPLTIINLEGSYEESKVYAALMKKQNIHEQIVELFKEKVDKVNN